MKMDGRDSAECQNWEKKDKMVILEFLNEDKTKHAYWSSSLLKAKDAVAGQGDGEQQKWWILVRECPPSL